MLNILDKIEKGLDKVKNYWDEEVMGYHFERIENYYTYKDGRIERMSFDTCLKVDKFGKVHDHVLVKANI